MFPVFNDAEPGSQLIWTVLIHGDEFAIAREQIADQCGLAALARTGDHDYGRILERGGYEVGSKAREKHAISIFHPGFGLRLIRITLQSMSD